MGNEDILGFIEQTGSTITGSFDSSTGELSLDGIDNIDSYRSALQSITYENTSVNPNTEPRSITWLVNDGTNDSNTITTSVTIKALNNLPVLGNAGNTLEFTEGTGGSFLEPGLSIDDEDNSNINSAKIQIIKNHNSTEDNLEFTKVSNIDGSYDNNKGILTLTGSDTLENYRKALQSVTYNNTSENPNSKTRRISWLINDGTNDSEPVTTTVTIKAINDLPVLANAESSLQLQRGRWRIYS